MTGSDVNLDVAPVPDRPGTRIDDVSAAIQSIDRWSEGRFQSAIVDTHYRLTSVGICFSRPTDYRINVSIPLPAASIPSNVKEALARLYGFRIQIAPGAAYQSGVPISSKDAIVRSGAVDILTGEDMLWM